MKTVPAHYASNTEKVQAYTAADLKQLSLVFVNAEHAWHKEWIAQGRNDEGSCTGGKGLAVWFVGPRKRSAKRLVVVPFHVQGNVAAQKTKHAAEAVLKANGIAFSYCDGWLD